VYSYLQAALNLVLCFILDNKDTELEALWKKGGLAGISMYFSYRINQKPLIMKAFYTFTMCLLTLFMSSSLFAQPGTLDPNFGVGGIVHTEIGVEDSNARALLLLDDGSMIAVGQSENPAVHFTVAKYLPDGSLAPGFGFGSGTTHFNMESNDANAWAIGQQSDGKFLVTGQVNSISSAFGLARLNADGSIDNSFGDGDGRVVTPVGSTCFGLHVMELSDGKLLVTGLANSFTLVLIKYNSDGSLDPNFDSDGILEVNVSGDNGGFFTHELPDGKLLVGGFTGGPTSRDYGVFRFMPDGTLDNSFGTDGIANVDFDEGFDTARGMGIQSDGKILLFGQAGMTGAEFGICRLNQDGTLDTSFSFDGKVLTTVGASFTTGWDVLQQPDGKILAVGSANKTTGNFDYDMILIRYMPDGLLDDTFGDNGVVRIDASQENENDRAYQAALQEDGLIVVAGYANVGGVDQFTLIRVVSGINVGTVDLGLDHNSLFVYPNPVREEAIQLEYELLEAQEVSFHLVSSDGKSNMVLDKGVRNSGAHTETLTLPTGLAAGNYWLRVETGKGQASVQLIIVR
jgi:uncharacterized delta-60 repeat protein